MTAGADLRLLRAAVFTAVCVTLSAAGHALAGGPAMPPWTLGAGCAVVFAVAAPLAGRERSLPGIVALLAAGQVALHSLFACGGAAGGARRGMAAMPGMHGMPGGAGAGAAGSGAAAGSGSGAGQGSGLRELAGRLLCDGGAGHRLTTAEARRVLAHSGLSPHQLAAHGGPSGAARGSVHAVAQSAHAAHSAAAGPGAGPLDCLRSAAHAALSLLNGPMLLGHLLAALVLGWLLRRGEAALWRLVRLSARSARTAWSSAPEAAARLAPVRALRTAVAWVAALGAGLLPEAPPRAVPGRAREKTVQRPVLLRHSVRRRGPPLMCVGAPPRCLRAAY